MTTGTDVCELVDVSPEMVQKWIADGEAILVDVREDFEHASERIEQSRNHCLSKFDAEQLRKECGDCRVVFYCRTGKRSSEAATKFGGEQVFHLQGGIEGWKAAERPVLRSASAPKIDIMRQVHRFSHCLWRGAWHAGESLALWDQRVCWLRADIRRTEWLVRDGQVAERAALE